MIKKLLASVSIMVVLVFLTGVSPAFATNTNDAVFTSTANKNLKVADTVSLSPTGGVTLEFWFNPTGTPADVQGVVTKYGTAGTRSWFIQRDGASPTTLTCGFSGDGSAFKNVTTVKTFANGSWFFVACRFNPSTDVTTYWGDSGNSPAQDAQNTTSIPASLNDGTSGVDIGAFEAFESTAANVYAGSIDDVRIYTSARTLAQIQSDYNCQLTSFTGMAAYWTLNNVLTDSTANANNLTNNGTVVINDTSVPFSANCASATTFNPSNFWDY